MGDDPSRPQFRVRNGFIETVDQSVFVRRPVALMELFVLLARNPQYHGITASTIRQIRDHLYVVDAEFRRERRG